jgi:predicted nucleic acid-binding protein
MILYLDTSALVKRYFKEPYSEDVINNGYLHNTNSAISA